ncbi:MAG: OB-fold domain-containing protein [Chloroflexi bacterium]|nr:OB-fold domain-containing protein [Chloroflexota bacterium]
MSEKPTGTSPAPIGEGYFVIPAKPSERPRLLGNKCRSCGEVFFPRRVACRNCSSQDMEDIVFSSSGKLYAFTTIRVRPPHCIVPVPYMLGIVELEGGERVRTLLTDCDQSSLEIGMDMELGIESIGKAQEPVGKIEVGQEVQAWKFRPVRKRQ